MISEKTIEIHKVASLSLSENEPAISDECPAR